MIQSFCIQFLNRLHFKAFFPQINTRGILCIRGEKSSGVLWSLIFWLTLVILRLTPQLLAIFLPLEDFSVESDGNERFYSSNLHATFSHVLTLLRKLLYFRVEKN